MDVDVQTYLPGDLLAKVDITTMACSLEARSPFLDHHLMEWAAGLPAQLKVRWMTTKFLLKQAMLPWLPDDLVTRRKQGFGVPIASWLRTELRDMSWDVLTDPTARSRGLFRPEAVSGLLSEHEQGIDHSTRIWALIQFELWHRNFIDTQRRDRYRARRERTSSAMTSAHDLVPGLAQSGPFGEPLPRTPAREPGQVDLLEDVLIAAQPAGAGLQVTQLEAERVDAAEYVFRAGHLEGVPAHPVDQVVSPGHAAGRTGGVRVGRQAAHGPDNRTDWPVPLEVGERAGDQQSAGHRAGGVVEPLHPPPHPAGRALIVVNGDEEQAARRHQLGGRVHRAPEITRVMEHTPRVDDVGDPSPAMYSSSRIDPCSIDQSECGAYWRRNSPAAATESGSKSKDRTCAPN